VRVALLAGGRSSEHDVSLASAAAIRAGLLAAGHEVTAIEIDRDGTWRCDSEPVSLRPGEVLLGADVVFPALHGPFGEDGTVQGMLETLDVAYVGAGVAASAVCMDKVLFKRLLSAGAPAVAQVDYVGVRERRWRAEPDRVLAEVAKLGLPVFVKPAHLGSSVGIVRVTEQARIADALEQALAHDELVIVEATAPGIEVECGVLGLPLAQQGESVGGAQVQTPALASEPGEIMFAGEWYDYAAKYESGGMELIVHHNPEALARGINPFDHGTLHTDLWKTEGLKQALTKYEFDAAFGGARRDEEKSRAKERVFSFRSTSQRWDPKNQRPELWSLYNARKARGESIRVFPLSNWTELDIWQYIHLENIPIVPLYFAAPRPTVQREGLLLMVDDERFRLNPGERPVMRSIRFRTLGCYPLTGAVESTAITLPQIIQEMLLTTTSERQGRAIDHDQAASMEKKKQEGYF